VRVAASSETPVKRWYGTEILDHGPGAVRSQRLDLGMPVLNQHAMREQLGVVEEWEIGPDRVLRAWLRFSRSARAEEIWQDVRDGIRRNISIGYMTHLARLEQTSDDGSEDVYRVIDWEPYEVSTVSAGADPTAGVGRGFEARGETSFAPTGGETMSAEATSETRGAGAGGGNGGGAPAAAPVAATRDLVAEERARAAEILALGDRHGQRAEADAAVLAGTTVDAFRALLLERLGAPEPSGEGAPAGRGAAGAGGRPPAVSAATLGLSGQEVRQYRLMRAINAAATGDWKSAGFERQVSLAIAEEVGRDARGFYVPHEVLLSRRDVEKATGKGVELVATSLMAEAFIDVMRARALVGQLGAVILPGLIGDVDIPRKAAGASFYWLGEKVDVTVSELALQTVPLTPKTVAGAVPVTRRMRKQSSLAVEQLLRDDLVDGIAVQIDQKLIAGDGTGNTPVGLMSASGVGSEVVPVGGIDWATLVAMETDVRAANIVGPGSFAYLTTPAGRGAAKTTEKSDGTGLYLMEGGEINGYRAEDSTNVPANAWIFGDWAQVLIGMWGVIDVQVDTAALAARDGLVVRVFQDLDTALRLPAAFSVAEPA